MILEPLLHSLCLLVTEVLGVFHSRGDAVLEGGQVTVLEVQLGHCLIWEPGKEHLLKVREAIDKVVAYAFLQRCVKFAIEKCKHGNTSMHTHHGERHPICTGIRYCIPTCV